MSSQRSGDRAVALNQLSHAGAVLTTTESAIMALCQTAAHPSFKQVSKLLKEHSHAGVPQLI